MKATGPFREEGALQFFGKIMASVNHDVRNIFATINENAGLLMDYSALALNKPVDPKKLKVLAGRIADQIKRGDRLLNCMGEFSHSVDDFVKTVDLNEILHILLVLTERFASMRKVTLRENLSPGPLQMRTSPFLLLHILFFFLEFALEAAEKGQYLDVTPQKNGSEKSVRFSPLPGLVQIPPESLSSVYPPDFLPFFKIHWSADIQGKNMNVVFSECHDDEPM